jgi:penicillin-binding protein 1B
MSPPVPGSAEAPPQRERRIPAFREAVLSPRRHPALFAIAWSGAAIAVAATVFSVRYSWLIYQRLREGPFATSSAVYAAPRTIEAGESLTPQQLIAALQRSGYSTDPNRPAGCYLQRGSQVEVRPGPRSYFRRDPVMVTFANGRVNRISSVPAQHSLRKFQIEPELISNLADKNRERRRPVSYADLPPVLVRAVTAAEDKRFFEHTGFDPMRILKAAYVDMREMRKEQGASTLTMQLARMMFLDQEKAWGRKLAEAYIALHLEFRFSKQQIFEYYANHVYLGRRGSFSIHGFGEAARAYLGKDIRQVTLPEAAMLAGIIQRPSYFNPFRWPDRMRARRNVVLGLMLQNGAITQAQYAIAIQAPLQLATPSGESTDAPYFVDLVNQELQTEFENLDFYAKSYSIYTTLDLDLQRDAAIAAQNGMREVDALLARRAKKGTGPPQAQVSLVCLDARTGDLKALIGGRDYGLSQLNRALARRQPGSVFKPFVYAAALSGPLNQKGPFVTPASIVEDAPAEFRFQGQVYTPGNFRDVYNGEVTVRYALAKSLNVPTVHLAEMAGYGEVARLAKAVGMNRDIQGTPAVALGSYDVTPLEVAGAYTVFSRMGRVVKPNWIQTIRDGGDNVLHQHRFFEKAALDPRVAYIMIDLMQEVLRTGTGGGVRSRGFTAPAAGKTGTSRDGWFAGFTSELLTVVWVGFDDGRELGLEGAKSALPIWTEFMKRAHQHAAYRNPQAFDRPKGLERAQIDAGTGKLATPGCEDVRDEIFLAGSAPTEYCPLHLYTEPAGPPQPLAPRNLWNKLKGIFR